MPWYHYKYSHAVQRDFEIPWLTPVLIFVGLIFIIIITLVNVVAQGYETIVYTSTDYNATHGLWYDKFVPSKGKNYSHRSCENGLIRLNDYVSTNSDFNFFLYQLLNYINTGSDNSITSTINGVNYTNNPFFDCSISSLQMTEYLEPVSPDLKATAIVGCNTTSNKYLQLRTSTDTGVTAQVDLSPNEFKQYIQGLPGPYAIEDSIVLWALITRKIWYSLTTVQNGLTPLYDRNSLLRQSVVGGPAILSYLRFAYTDTYFGETPADGSWTMQVTFRNDSSPIFTSGTITFLPSGKVGSSNPPDFLNTTNTILSPTIATIQKQANATNVANFDFWELMNWMFVSQYWLLLLDFGQIAPSTFRYDSQTGNRIDYGPIRHTAEYNIFVNSTLFDQYNSYLRQTVLPLFGYTLAEFLPINDTNRMNETVVSLKMLYTCSDLRLKDSAGLIISVIVADWGMISSVIAVGLFVLAAWRLRGERDANHCKGCVEIVRQGSFTVGTPPGGGAPPLSGKVPKVTEKENVENGKANDFLQV